MKILGAVLELPAKQHCQNFDSFSIAMGADHSFYVKTIETHARAFLPLNISAIGTVKCVRKFEISLGNLSIKKLFF